MRDAVGRLVQTIEYREPEFDDHQVALMIAFARYRADVGSHGQLISEATSDRANPNNYEGGYRFVTDAPVTDWAEKSRLDRIDEYRKEAGEKANMNGLIFSVRKVEDQPAE